MKKIAELQAALQSLPPSALEKAGVSVEHVKAAAGVLIKDVKYGKYFHVNDVTSDTGQVEISGLSSGEVTEKNK